MTAIHTLSALAAGALALSAAGAVQAQTPYTRYQTGPAGVPSSCRNVEQLANGYVSAECPTEGGFRWSSIRAADCRGALSNRDGVLSCSGAAATVGPLYPDDAYGTGRAAVQDQPGGVFGALLGALFGGQVAGQDDRALDDAWSRGRRPLYERRADLDARIDAGVRAGSISRTEASRLRGEYEAIVQLETRYAADGRMTTTERGDLRDRYRALTQRVGDERRDYDDEDYGWRPLVEQRAAFDARVDVAVRDRALTRAEGARLRADFDALVRLESDYRRDGLSAREQEDLTARLADLDRRIGDVGWDGGSGYDPRAAEIEARIVAAERSGRISRSEAARLRDELRDLTRRWADLEARVSLRR